VPHAPSSHVLLVPNSKHLTHGISNLVSLITKTKLGLSHTHCGSGFLEATQFKNIGRISFLDKVIIMLFYSIHYTLEKLPRHPVPEEDITKDSELK
jgi:hypothetical protein